MKQTYKNNYEIVFLSPSIKSKALNDIYIDKQEKEAVFFKRGSILNS
jgi:hypothetical protein